jgi:hypothetical protein
MKAEGKDKLIKHDLYADFEVQPKERLIIPDSSAWSKPLNMEDILDFDNPEKLVDSAIDKVLQGSTIPDGTFTLVSPVGNTVKVLTPSNGPTSQVRLLSRVLRNRKNQSTFILGPVRGRKLLSCGMCRRNQHSCELLFSLLFY